MSDMGETTKLTKATSKSDSLRTTVPAGIVRNFEMKEGDSLDWSMEAKGSRLVIQVKYIRQERILETEKKKVKSEQKGMLSEQGLLVREKT
jgi:hypothetical protein